MKSRSFSKVEEVYHAARARPVAEREGFLSRACGGDEALLREVKSLLAYEEEAKRLLEEPVGEAATRRLAIVRGRRLGPYEVGDLIGAGGMGEVYRAHDMRLGRDVAVKVLPEHVAQDPEALVRFSREARAVASLSHPHIAALFDIGEDDGTHYLVMELLEGRRWPSVCGGGRCRRRRWPKRWGRRTGRGWCTATSSRPTSGGGHGPALGPEVGFGSCLRGFNAGRDEAIVFWPPPGRQLRLCPPVSSWLGTGRTSHWTGCGLADRG